MNISIDRIRLQNFKGIADLAVEFGQETAIMGSNATGKTTIFDAFLWALFGKDSLNQATFDIKALSVYGTPAHNLEHSVEVALSVAGQPFVVKRIYQEKWTKKRGNARPEFTGHTTDYYVDGVPLKEKEYQGRIQGLIDEGVFRLLTDPRYFNEILGWKDRRRVLLEVCGDVSDAEVMASDKRLAGLADILGGHNIDDFRKIIAGQKKEINEQLEKIPVRIDEATRSLATVREDIGMVPGMISGKEEVKAHLESQLADARNGGALSAKRIELQNVSAEIQEFKNIFERDRSILIAPLNKELEAAQDKARAIIARKKDLEASISERRREMGVHEGLLAELRQKWIDTDAQEFTGDTICPACGQNLPETKIEKAKEKFLSAKATKLESINRQGTNLKMMVESLQSAIRGFEDELAAMGDVTAIREHEIQKQIADIRAQQPNLSLLESKKAGIQAELDELIKGGDANTQKIEAQLAEVKDEIRNLTADLQKAESNKATNKRIAELTEQEKLLAAEFEKVDGEMYLLESFVRAKVSLLEGRINDKFRLARFKLFQDQLNGGLQDVCETTYQGVPYSSMNNAARIQVGLDIARTLQAHYGIVCPVWIDNRESVVEIPEMAGQVISLIVSEQDKQLRVEARELKKVA